MARWTPKLHGSFMEAVNQLGGIERASPEDVLKLMQDESLTISNIESYLQEYKTAIYNDPGSSSQATPSLRLEIDRQNREDHWDVHFRKQELLRFCQMHEGVMRRSQMHMERRMELMRRTEMYIEAALEYMRNIGMKPKKLREDRRASTDHGSSPEDVLKLITQVESMTISDIESYLQEYRTPNIQNEVDIDDRKANSYSLLRGEELLRRIRMNMDITKEKARRYQMIMENREKLSEERRASTDHGFSLEDVLKLITQVESMTISDIESYLQEYRTANIQNEVDIDDRKANSYSLLRGEELLRRIQMNMDITKEKVRRYHMIMENREKLSEERRASTDRATRSDPPDH